MGQSHLDIVNCFPEDKIYSIEPFNTRQTTTSSIPLNSAFRISLHVGTAPSSFCPKFTHLLHQTHHLYLILQPQIPLH
jgi:hypothetical protein